MLSSLLPVTALLAIAPSIGPADIWVVDDDLGPGVDFEEISDALTVAADGDTILVEAGTYAPFTVSQAVAILGRGDEVDDVRIDGPFPTDQVLVEGVSHPFGVRLSRLRVLGGLEARNCGAPVLLVDLEVTRTVRVSGVVDLRALRLIGYGGATVEQATAQFVQSLLDGPFLPSGPFDPSFGGPGLHVGADARVVCASTQLLGGRGEDCECDPFGGFSYAGDGGPGLRLGPAGGGQEVTLLGPASIIEGGDGGVGESSIDDGDGGPGIQLDAGAGTLRFSSTTVVPGESPYTHVQAPPIVQEGGVLVEPTTPDPSMRLDGETTAGAAALATVSAAPGSAFVAFAGLDPLVLAVPGLVGELWTDLLVILDSGVVGPEGEVELAVPVPANAAPGFAAHFQAAALLPVSEERSRLSNAVPLMVP